MMQNLRVTVICSLTAFTLLSITGCENSPVSTATQSTSNTRSIRNTTSISDTSTSTTNVSSTAANHTSAEHTNPSTSKRRFDYTQYLPFTPLLPSYTAGHPLTHSDITRYLNTGKNGNAISYSASYANAFSITEGRPSELHMAVLPGSKATLILSNKGGATIQKYDGRESIDLTQNGLLVDVTSINDRISLQELERIATSISVPATQVPSEIHESDNGPQSVSELSFNPIKAGQFYVPHGYSLNVQGSAVNINGNSKSESFQITYRKGSSYLTITQLTGNQPDYANNTAYRRTMMHGVSVLEQHTNSMEPVAIFELPQTHVHVVVLSNITSSEVSKVVNSFLTTAMSRATH